MSDTIAALATPYGESAIAVIRISGGCSRELVCSIFGRTELLANVMYHGTYCSTEGVHVDDTMFVYFRGPRSYTGEDAAEIYTHGNMLIVSEILDDLCIRGCRLAERGEFTRRAFLNNKLDLCQAEAVVDVIHSSNEAALSASNAQLTGKLSGMMGEISSQMLDMLATLETHIDFVDDEIENNILTEEFHKNFKKLTSIIDTLLDTYKYRSVLFGGLNIAIIGRPNAGKSSLLNLLLDSDRALISPEPGTTRDFISESVVLDKYRLNLLDTAGLREHTTSLVEDLGIAKSIEKIKHADAYLFVLDTSDVPPVLPDVVMDMLSPANCCIFENKIDRPDSADYSGFMPKYAHVRCSTLKDERGKICQQLINFLNINQIVPNEVGVVVNVRHAAILKNVRKELQSAADALNAGQLEYSAENVRTALENLGEIVGKYTTDEMLDRLFNQFCIGK